MKSKTYLCIDFKFFYASVECPERRLNSMTTKLVFSDLERSDKNICLAASLAMKHLEKNKKSGTGNPAPLLENAIIRV